MTFVVDWAIDPTGALAVVSEEAMGELPSMARPGGVCVTVTGAVVVSEPEANRLRWTEPGAGCRGAVGPRAYDWAPADRRASSETDPATTSSAAASAVLMSSIQPY